jgi:hypothetical protein
MVAVSSRRFRSPERSPYLEHTVEDGPEYPVDMAESLKTEGISARLAEIRGQLKLLSDYL